MTREEAIRADNILHQIETAFYSLMPAIGTGDTKTATENLAQLVVGAIALGDVLHLPVQEQAEMIARMRSAAQAVAN